MFGILSSKYLHREVGIMVDAFAKASPPPASVAAGSRPIPPKMINESLDALFAQISTFARENRLGILGRARLAKALQEQLRLHRYPDEVVSRLVNAVTANALVATDRR